MERERKVKRVLVMLQYEDGAHDSGEVFDLTALSSEVATGKAEKFQDCRIRLQVGATRDYENWNRETNRHPLKSVASWSVSIDFNSSGDAAHLDDAINASLPDSLATQALRKRLSKVNRHLEKLKEDIQVQRLMDAATVRHQRPIARVTETPLLTVAEQPAA